MKLNKMIAIGLMGVMTMGVIAGCGADTKKAEGGVPASKVTGTVTLAGSVDHQVPVLGTATNERPGIS